jgi:hypothetical protein|tara:strand:- start:48961 stop:49281 length:321 start_codon:yes stop_codon:yes gene_type:complete
MRRFTGLARGEDYLAQGAAPEFGTCRLKVNIGCPGLAMLEKPENAGDNSLWHPDSHQSKIFRDPDVLKKEVKNYCLRRVGYQMTLHRWCCCLFPTGIPMLPGNASA